MMSRSSADPASHSPSRRLSAASSSAKASALTTLSAFERRALRVPMDVDCREDLHEMQQTVRDGRYSYSARRTAEGHSDRCTALALAVRASESPSYRASPAAVDGSGGHQEETL